MVRGSAQHHEVRAAVCLPGLVCAVQLAPRRRVAGVGQAHQGGRLDHVPQPVSTELRPAPAAVTAEVTLSPWLSTTSKAYIWAIAR